MYTSDWRNAKMLAIGKDLINKFKMSPCQDACYFDLNFSQLERNQTNYIESEDHFPNNLLYIPTAVGPNVEQFTFGDLIALYGDFRRTVYYKQVGEDKDADVKCYLTCNEQNSNIFLKDLEGRI
jgi:hypothetical protein